MAHERSCSSIGGMLPNLQGMKKTPPEGRVLIEKKLFE